MKRTPDSTVQIGRRAEASAVRFLMGQGYSIVAQNISTRYGEIDIIAMDGPFLVFAEVRFRRSSRYGTPEETVNYRKRRKIFRAAQKYLLGWDGPWPRCRFDVISVDGGSPVTFLLTKNAFDETML